MPTITQLEYVLAVHTTGHFGRAARELGISQPTLSSQVQKVEQELGLTLFDRQTKPIALTEQAAPLLEPMRAVVVAHERLLAAATGSSAELAGPFSVGVIPTLAPYVLPWFLREFAERYPEVELSVFERPTDEILSEIAASRMDAAILATPLDEPSIHEEVLFYDPFYLYAHGDEPLLAKEAIAVEDIDSRKLWLLEDGHCFRAQVINLCGLHQRELLGSVRFAGGSFETLRHLIDASEGYTLVPETFARTLSRRVRKRSIRPFDARIPTREVSIISHRLSWKGEVRHALAEVVTGRMPRCFQRELAEEEVMPVRVEAARGPK